MKLSLYAECLGLFVSCDQGTLTIGEDSVQLTSSLRWVFYKYEKQLTCTSVQGGQRC